MLLAQMLLSSFSNQLPTCKHAVLPPCQGGPKKYGSAYTMEIKDTVVEGVEGSSEGSDEFLVFSSALTKAAAAHGLHPVSRQRHFGCGCGAFG